MADAITSVTTNPSNVEAFYSAKLDPGENPVDAVGTLTALCEKAVDQAAKPVLEASEHQQSKAKMTRSYRGQKLKDKELLF